MQAPNNLIGIVKTLQLTIKPIIGAGLLHVTTRNSEPVSFNTFLPAHKFTPDSSLDFDIHQSLHNDSERLCQRLGLPFHQPHLTAQM